MNKSTGTKIVSLFGTTFHSLANKIGTSSAFQVTQAVLVGLLMFCFTYSPNAFANPTNNPPSYEDDYVRVEVVSLQKQNSRVLLTLRFNNLTNEPFKFGLVGVYSSTKAYLTDNEGGDWQYIKDDRGLTHAVRKFVCLPGEWSKVTIEFSKPTGSLDGQYFNFSCSGSARIGGNHTKFNIFIKKIYESYSSSRRSSYDRSSNSDSDEQNLLPCKEGVANTNIISPREIPLEEATVVQLYNKSWDQVMVQVRVGNNANALCNPHYGKTKHFLYKGSVLSIRSVGQDIWIRRDAKPDSPDGQMTAWQHIAAFPDTEQHTMNVE